MRRMLAPSFATALGAVLTASATAQIYNGPPIPPGQVLRHQAAPLPGSPPPIAATPSPPPVNAGALPGPFVVNPNALPGPAVVNRDALPAGPVGSTAYPRTHYRDRAAWCQHQATVERVPRRHRGAYVHNCIN